MRELSGGFQSRVFDARLRGRQVDRRVVAKLSDRRLVDARRLATCAEAITEIAAHHSGVVAPTAIDDTFVHQVGEWFAVLYPYVDGEPVDADLPDGAASMGRELAMLHRSMAGLRRFELPVVRALRHIASHHVGGSDSQLLHGDFSSANLRLDPNGRIRIFDFDDCGYGPVEFEVANSVFMVLFDATVDDDVDRYERFRTGFVTAYCAESAMAIADHVLDDMIDVRRDALQYWLDHLDVAPIGIRMSSPAWHDRLRAFVDADSRSAKPPR